MTQVDSVPAILGRLADLVECADSLTYVPPPCGIRPSMADSKRCPDSSAGLPCYDEWCIKNNDCLDRIARTQTLTGRTEAAPRTGSVRGAARNSDD